jgi:hypothetical protein
VLPNNALNGVPTHVVLHVQHVKLLMVQYVLVMISQPSTPPPPYGSVTQSVTHVHTSVKLKNVQNGVPTPVVLHVHHVKLAATTLYVLVMISQPSPMSPSRTAKKSQRSTK